MKAWRKNKLLLQKQLNLFPLVEFSYFELTIHERINVRGNIEIDYINCSDGPFNDSRSILKEWNFGVTKKNYNESFLKDYAYKLNNLTGGRIVHQKQPIKEKN